MKINTDSILFDPRQILIIEEKMNAKYVCETCLRKGDTWWNQPFAIFYQETPHPQGSNYFALFFVGDGSQMMVTDGITATEEFTGVKGTDGVVYFSRYRHDFRQIPGGFVDGGRDYLRCGDQIVATEVVKLKIVDGQVVPAVEFTEVQETKALEYHPENS